MYLNFIVAWGNTMCKGISLLTMFALALLFVFITPPVSAQFLQQGPKLVGSDAAGIARQGISVSISADGSTAIAGGFADNGDTGAAWIYTRSGVLWTQQGSKLVGTGSVGHPLQGLSVAISADGSTAVIGGPYDDYPIGATWIFTGSGGVWTQQGSKLVGTGAIGGSEHGTSVAISADGNTMIEGGPYDSSQTGAAWIFTRSGGVWTQQGDKLVGTGAIGSAQQGISVALSADGNTAIVGGYGDNSSAGAAWVYTRSGGVWTQQGDKLVGTGASGVANQGNSVSLSGDGNTAIVGGPRDKLGIGAAWVFTRSGGVWVQQGEKLVGTGGIAADDVYQGWSVSLSSDGNTALVGGYSDNTDVGATWVFTRSAGVWTQDGSKLVGTAAVGTSEQGISVSLSADGGTAIVGGDGDNSDAGAAWIFSRGAIGVEFTIQERWNMVSVPVRTGDTTTSGLFPTATSSAFAFDGGYITSATLESGRGYWIKFGSAQNISIVGLGLTKDTVDVKEGWNMIGALSVPISMANVGSIPGGIVTSPLYQYTGNYNEASTLEPGKGYWIKVSQSGLLIMTSSGNVPEISRIRTEDRGERPPSPPDGTGNTLPGEFALEQNFPNPFNPVTNIRYSLPFGSYVHLAVYDMLGREVTILADGMEPAGYKSIAFDAERLASGVYTYRLTAGTFMDLKRMVVVK